MLDRNAEMVLLASTREAAERGHEYVCLEHLLLAIAKHEEGARILEICGADITRLRKRLDSFLEEKIEKSQIAASGGVEQAIGFQRVLQRAILHAEFSSADKLSVGDLLAAVFTEPDSHAAYFLHQEGLNRLDVLECISHGMSEQEQGDDEDESPSAEDPSREKGTEPRKALERFTRSLNQRARDDEIDPLIGREYEIERAVHVLCRRNKNNPIFVGDQGVGKTAIVEGLALKVVRGEVPAKIRDIEIYALDLGSLIAGTRFRGDFEQRLKSVIRALEDNPRAVLFIDEIHAIVGAGATSGSTLDAANLLKPALASGKLRCIGSTTFEEYKNHFEKDRALARRFLKIDVLEPSVSETVQILQGLKSRFESHHSVRYSESALRRAAELSAKYINERFLPDKAIDVIDEAGAQLALAREENSREGQQPAKESNSQTAPVVTASHIDKVVARLARIPPQAVSMSEREKLRQLEPQLKQVIFGQDEAISALCRAIRRARAGLIGETKPIGSFLFAGPTGVGKTEVARQLAGVLGLELVRFDMSEYMEKHTVSRLIGAPPGYVGFDQGGLLTDAIIRNPHTVLLLDEIEKAHPDLFNLLLQVMDHACLTDNNGRKADFRNVIIIMTSNVGSENMFGQPVGFNAGIHEVSQGIIEKAFRPEFRNRLDLILKFRPLETEVIERIVDKFITEIDTQLIARKASVLISGEARRWIATRGYTAQYGARSIHRLMQQQIKDPLADELLFGELAQGGTARVELEEDSLKIRFERLKRPRRSSKVSSDKQHEAAKA